MTEASPPGIGELLESKGYSSSVDLLAALEDVQAQYGVVSAESVAGVAVFLGVAEARVQALLADCPDAFVSRPLPAIRICNGPVCRNAGSEALLDQAMGRAAASHCLGACDHAPVAKVNGELIPEADPDKLGL